jgi:site-specific recombinase XerD
MKRDPLFSLVQSFFDEHLAKVRGASPHTTAAYRDTLKLFLKFVAQQQKVTIERLHLDHLNATNVSAFLLHLEHERGNSIATRNCRRIALRGFFQHALRHDPTRAAQYTQVLALPAKRGAPTVPRYLEAQQIRLLLEQPDRRHPRGQRDYALLLFLYNTGARISEAVSIRRRDLQAVPPFHVRVLGKGRKERLCPLWPDTIAAIKMLLAGTKETADPAEAVFRGTGSDVLTRHGATHLLAKHVAAARRHDATFPKRVSPHTLRHSCACALLQAGVDLTVIRDYLGHASIVTTSRYANTNIELKRVALATFWEHAGLTAPKGPPWRPTKSLLSYLSSL